MKDKRWIILVLLLVILFGLFFIRGIDAKKKQVPIGDIKYFNFSYTTGYASYSNVKYDLNCESNNCFIKVKLSGIPEEEAVEKSIDSDITINIKEILEKYNVGKWNGFSASDKNVTDGNSFDLSIGMDNNDSIHASGYMKWPRKYSEFKKEIDILFSKYAEDEDN